MTDTDCDHGRILRLVDALLEEKERVHTAEENLRQVVSNLLQLQAQHRQVSEELAEMREQQNAKEGIDGSDASASDEQNSSADTD